MMAHGPCPWPQRRSESPHRIPAAKHFRTLEASLPDTQNPVFRLATASCVALVERNAASLPLSRYHGKFPFPNRTCASNSPPSRIHTYECGPSGLTRSDCARPHALRNPSARPHTRNNVRRGRSAHFTSFFGHSDLWSPNLATMIPRASDHPFGPWAGRSTLSALRICFHIPHSAFHISTPHSALHISTPHSALRIPHFCFPRSTPHSALRIPHVHSPSAFFSTST